MKKQTFISFAAFALLTVGLWIFQEHAEALSGEIVSFIFAFSTSVVVGVLSYFKGKQKGNSARMVRQQGVQANTHSKRSVPA